MRGHVVGTARAMVVSLYSLPQNKPLECMQRVAGLLSRDSWIGEWDADGDGPRWFTKTEPAALIFAHFFESNALLGRQMHCHRYWVNRVTPQLICFAATALNCALREYEKGIKNPCEFRKDIFDGKLSLLILGPVLHD
jgi:hypothetical protein